MNGTFVFVLSIIAIVMGASVMREWIKQKNKEPDNAAELEATLAKIDILEERIQVLERIITENRFDLKNEIDSL